MLPSYIRVIQGDGISYESLKEILGNLEAANLHWQTRERNESKGCVRQLKDTFLLGCKVDIDKEKGIA